MSVTFFIGGTHNPHAPCAEYCGECEGCKGYEAYSRDNELNVSNGNACEILHTLGLPTDELWGDLPARQLKWACTEALAVCTDEEIPQTSHGNVINCGRRAGYLREKFTALIALASLAGDIGRIVWG